jgi:glucose/arabinose dehydrogenase
LWFEVSRGVATAAVCAALMAVLVGGATPSAATTGLVAAYSFDAGSGTTVADSSGNNNVGTIVGATWSTAGKYGRALSFDATRKTYVRIADAPSLRLTSGLTIEAWVRPAVLTGSWRTVVFKERPAGSSYALYANDGANRPLGQVTIAAEQSSRGTAQLPVNVWTHLATTYDGSALRLYVNGTQVSSTAVSGSIVSSTGLLKIGGNAIWSEWYSGLVDDVRIYNRALPASQVAADMAAPVGQDTTPPATPGGLQVTSATQTSLSFSWSASTDDTAVAGYGVYRDGTLVATASTTTATVNGLACGRSYQLGVDAFDQAGNRSAVAAIAGATSACPNAPPTVQLTAPAAGSKVAGQVTVTADASDDTGVIGVQFQLDGNNLRAEDVSAPYSVTWDTSSVADGQHTLAAVARDSAGATATAAAVVTVQNQAAQPSLVLETAVTGLTEPTQMVFTPDGRMLILQRSGSVLVVLPGASQALGTPMLQLTSVNTSDERGALGIVLDPAFASNGFFYVMYTHSSLINRVSRFTAVGNTASLASERIVWQNDVAADIYHQGGGLAFGADGDLYVSVGDNLTPAAAQSLTSFNGKILRLAPDGSVPADNPFNDGAGPNKDAIWALGFRNPFRIVFDAPSGRLLVADVGQSTKEEVDLAVAGANYGWPTCEGVCAVSGMTNPIYSYDHNGRDASITGGLVYHGSQLGPAYDGSYFYADYAQNWIKRLTFAADGTVAGSQSFVPADGSVDGPYGDPVSICQGPDGALYYVDIGALSAPGGGTIRRVRNPGANRPPVVSASANPVAGQPPLMTSFSSAGTSDPEGDPLTYAWDFGDGATSTQPSPVHTYAASGTYSARLAVSDGTSTTLATPITIRVGNPPAPTISSPAAGSTFRGGQVITFSGSATDAEDGTLSGASLSWTIVFHHETHDHPGPGPFAGSSGSFTVPSSGHDFTGSTSYELFLTATDSSGLSTTTSVVIRPEKVNVTFASVPSGLTVVVDSLAHVTPYTFDSLVGFQHGVDAASPQSSGGSSYSFASWSDGGARSHTVTVAAADQTYTANFTKAAAPTGLVAAYSFREGTGTAIGDSSGNGNNGTLVGGTWTTAGRNGSALVFNGTSTMVTVPDAPSLDLTTGMTLEAWVNPTLDDASWRSVIFKERPGGMLYSLYAANGAHRPTGQVFVANAERDATGQAPVQVGTWSHLATTYDGSNVRFYANGVLAGTLPFSGSLASTTNPLRIGGNTIWGEFFSGMIDDVRIYSRALTAAEIQSDSATPVG